MRRSPPRGPVVVNHFEGLKETEVEDRFRDVLQLRCRFQTVRPLLGMEDDPAQGAFPVRLHPGGVDHAEDGPGLFSDGASAISDVSWKRSYQWGKNRSATKSPAGWRGLSRYGWGGLYFL